MLRRELKTGRRAFLLWTFGLFFIVVAGLTKFTGFAGNTEVLKIFDDFPKIVLAVFGMVGVDVSTLPGFYAILAFYSIICAVIYGISLGANAVNRESIDKTYEFIFTKPRSRFYVINIKLLGGIIYLTAFCLLNLLFSFAATALQGIENTISEQMVLFSVAMWLISFLFFMLCVFLSALINKPEKGAQAANAVFLLSFLIGMAYDILENAAFLRYFAPLKYFSYGEVLSGTLNTKFIIICLVASFIFYTAASLIFSKKDLLD